MTEGSESLSVVHRCSTWWERVQISSWAVPVSPADLQGHIQGVGLCLHPPGNLSGVLREVLVSVAFEIIETSMVLEVMSLRQQGGAFEVEGEQQGNNKVSGREVVRLMRSRAESDALAFLNT